MILTEMHSNKRLETQRSFHFSANLTCKSLCETGNGGLVECEDTEQIGKVGEGVIDLESRGIVLNAVMNVHTQQ